MLTKKCRAEVTKEVSKSSVDECRVIFANKGEQVDGTNELHGVSFVANDDILEEDIPSEVLPCQLPPKELNLGSFTLHCTIGSLNLYAMANLGASINIMPKSMFEHLKLANLKKSDMLIKMADMTRIAPLGIVENILVKINKFIFPSDFVIMDMLGEPNETMILSRPFLATIHAKIDVFNRETSLGIGEDRVLFDMDGSDTFNDGKSVHGMLKQWMCFRDNERQSVKGNRMIFADFLKVRYGNKIIDDTTRDRRYYEWVAQNSEFNDNGISHKATMYDNPFKYHHEYPRSSFPQKNKGMPKPWEPSFNKGCTKHKTPMDHENISVPSQTLTPKEIIDPFHQDDLILNIKTYFPDYSQSQPSKPQPKDYSYEEWLRIKLGYTNVSKSVWNAILNERVLDSFDIEADYGRTRDDPYSRRFNEYKKCNNPSFRSTSIPS
ncbi:phospholipase-like protein [Tanacetum coccineum]